MEHTKETSPDELMDTFEGRGLKSIIVFTIIVHAVVLLGTSVPFLRKQFLGSDSSELSEEERTQLAVKEATASLREIAEEHGLKPQDLSTQVAGGAPKAPVVNSGGAPSPPDPVQPADPEKESGEPKSAIEKEMEKVEKGPAAPPVAEDDEEDLFR